MRSFCFIITCLWVEKAFASPPCDYSGCARALAAFSYQQQVQPLQNYPYPSASYNYNRHEEDHHDHKPKNQDTYVPAPKGKLPKCAEQQSFSTYCEKIDTYPMDLIQKLASTSTSNFNFKSIFADESGEGFKRHVPEKEGKKGGDFNPDLQGMMRGNDGKMFQNDAMMGSSEAGSAISTDFPFQGGPRGPFDYSVFNQSHPQMINRNGAFSGKPYRSHSNNNYYNNNGGGGEYYSAFIQPSVDLTPNNPMEWWKMPMGFPSGFWKYGRRVRQAGTELCPTKSQFIMPKAALNSRGEWKYVVNVDRGEEKYTQLVRSETCLTKECNGICSPPNGYASKCEQKYVQKRLIALEGTGSQLYTDVFWFPHCCICQVGPDIMLQNPSN